MFSIPHLNKWQVHPSSCSGQNRSQPGLLFLQSISKSSVPLPRYNQYLATSCHTCISAQALPKVQVLTPISSLTLSSTILKPCSGHPSNQTFPISPILITPSSWHLSLSNKLCMFIFHMHYISAYQSRTTTRSVH